MGYSGGFGNYSKFGWRIKMEQRADYDSIVKEMPAGLDRAVLRVLSGRIGRENAIGRKELTELVGRHGFRAHERQVRETIKALRREGHLICSAAGEDGGYYLAKDKREYDEFRQAEFAAKIVDMNETLRAMDAAAERQFGKAMQKSLF